MTTNSTPEQSYWTNLVEKTRETLHILKNQQTGQLQVLNDALYTQWVNSNDAALWQHIGLLPPAYPEWLGSQTFTAAHRTRFPYIVGEMANGIATAEMVIASVKAGMMGFFGAAGLMPAVIEKNIHVINNALGHNADAWGSNLIHSPQEPHLEEKAVDLYLHYGVRRVSTSAYMSLNPNVVYYACKGLTATPEGEIVRQNFILAKISRPEIAKLFMSPAPQKILSDLVAAKKLTPEEAALAAHIPLAEDITVEGDSGGHTDNRPLTALFPTIYKLAEQLTQQYGYRTPIRVGAAGGLGTPSAIAAAFSMGAAYVLTGSVNHIAVESGLSEEGKQMLAQAGIADVAMAAAADMFEMGVKLQVLKRGTLFSGRANKLYDIYSQNKSLEAISDEQKKILETQILNRSLDSIWEETMAFFKDRDPAQLSKAEKDAKHKMALVFRWYLGLSSRWAIAGDSSRKSDYQIWCGPAMGAFNDWVRGSFLEALSERTVEQIGKNLLEGAAVILRAQQLRSYGFQLPAETFDYSPRRLA
ncbi:MAG: Enoyl-[acyl-carrier-protein] reductase [Gammaproteobacteria bacterium]|nr:Enoyl-[acyl-carrier-protein] reductase [Gammaproteobacteria bacterium]